MGMSVRRPEAMARSLVPDAEGAGVAVIGAGIIGLCSALHLRRAGLDVTVYDAGGAAAGASFGNAGLISIDSCVPGPMPGMVVNVPRWLADPLGPLTIDPSYLPRMFPWLYRFLRAGTPGRALLAAQALNAMHRDSFDHYLDLLGSERFNDLFRLSGQVQLWNGGPDTEAGRTIRKIWEQNKVKVKELQQHELRQLVPDISPEAKGGLFFPRNGYTVSPRRLVDTLLQCFLEEGGRFRQERVMRIAPEGGGRVRLVTNLDDDVFGKVVVSAGAWSRALLAPLGVKLALDTERGYHVMVHGPSVDLRVPVLDKSRGFGATPLENGIRIAGTVELAGLDKPPNLKRADILLEHARRLFPSLKGERYTMWMGFRPSTPDSLPIIDTVPGQPGICIACGHGHFGMTAASTTGLVVAQKVLGNKTAIDADPYRLGRF